MNMLMKSINFIRLRVAKDKQISNAPREEKEVRMIWARVVDIYDGDTFTICYVRDGIFFRRRCRCLGYDSPEIRTNNVQEKAAATRAKEFLKAYLPSSTSEFEISGLDKYGRFLISYTKNGRSLADVMIENGHGYAYAGGKKKQFVNGASN